MTDNYKQNLARYSSDVVKKGLQLTQKITLSKSEKKFEDCTKILTKSSNHEHLFKLGVEQYILGNISDAIDSFTKALEFNDRFCEAYFLRGFAHSFLGNNIDSKNDLYLGLKHKQFYQDSVIAFYSKIIIISELQASSFILSCYNDLLQIKTDINKCYNPIELSIQGAINRLLGNTQDALEKINEALKLNSNFVSSYILRAEIHNLLGDFDAAIEDCFTSLRLNPMHINKDNTLYILGSSFLSLEKYQSAIDYLDQSLALNGNLFNGFYNRGLVYYKMGQIKKAIKDFSDALIVKPTFVWAYINRGVAYYDLGCHQKSLDDYNQALVIDSKCKAAYVNRSIVFRELGNHEKALEDLQKAQTIID